MEGCCFLGSGKEARYLGDRCPHSGESKVRKSTSSYKGMKCERCAIHLLLKGLRNNQPNITLAELVPLIGN